MLPVPFTEDIQNIEIIRMPSLTYRLHPEKKRILGYTDGAEAVRQAVYKVLSTERYAYAIYTDRYGVEIASLTGASLDYVESIIEKRIRDCLLADDRITGIADFKVKRVSSDAILVQFHVVTVDGLMPIAWEVAA